MTAQVEQAVNARKDLEAKLVARAVKDASFRQRLLSDPKSALQEEIGQLAPGTSLPEGFQVEVLEEDDRSLYVVLPSKQSESRELSDEELQPVAGGILITGHTDFLICC